MGEEPGSQVGEEGVRGFREVMDHPSALQGRVCIVRVMIAPVFLQTAAVVAPLLRSEVLVERWNDPSALPEFRISGLAGHLARAVFNVETYLETEAPRDRAPMDAAAYFLNVGDPDAPLDEHLKQRIRELGEQEAGVGAADLADRFDAARSRLAVRLAAEEPDRLVLMFGDSVLTLEQALITRLVEMVVHLDDLAVSLEISTPAVPDAAEDVVVSTLARIARVRRGGLPVIRALSRRERGPYLITAF